MLAIRRFVSGVKSSALQQPCPRVAISVTRSSRLSSLLSRSFVSEGIKRQDESLSDRRPKYLDSESDSADTASGFTKVHKAADGSPIRPSKQIFCGNMLYQVTEDDLKAEMDRFGPIISVRIIKDPIGRSKGFGYVEFENQDDAAKAVEELHGQVFGGRRVTVQFAERRVPNTAVKGNHPPTKTLYVGNFHFGMAEKDFRSLFAEFRNVVEVRLTFDSRTGRHRGFAHAEFTDVESAAEAMNRLKEMEVMGRNLRVDYTIARSRTPGQQDSDGNSDGASDGGRQFGRRDEE